MGLLSSLMLLFCSAQPHRPKVMRMGDTRADRLLGKHREAWLKLGCPLGRVPVKAIEKSAFNAYRYLIKHDRAWLKAL
jgi:hypothetical protein